MTEVKLRRAEPEDLATIVALNDLAFGGRAEGKIVRALAADGDNVLSLVAERDGDLVGHIQFFRISVDGTPKAVGLGPMSVAPLVQKSGIGGQMMREGLAQLSSAGESCVFVLGHPTYYPKFGFDAEIAEAYAAPWSGPAFMAMRLSNEAPKSGALTYPAAFRAE